MNTNIKRILKDIKQFHDEKHEDIFIQCDESNIQNIKALIIGPRDSVFAGGFFYFTFDMKEFPTKPPKVKFCTPQFPTFRIHPNLYANGKVCLSILNTWGSKEWSAMLSIGKILITIQALLDDNPIANEPAFYGCNKNLAQAKDYALMSRLLTMQSIASMRTRLDLPNEFKEIIQDYVKKNKEIYLCSIDVLNKNKGSRIQTIHGNYTISNYDS